MIAVTEALPVNPICPTTVALFVGRGTSVVQISNPVPLAITLQDGFLSSATGLVE